MLPTPPKGYYSESDAHTKLFAYVSAGKYDFVLLPKRAEPPHADKLLEQTLDNKDLRVKALGLCGNVMRFYDLRGRAQQLVKWLDRGEAREQFPRSVLATGLAGDFGDDKLQERAVKHYQFLLTQKGADKYFRELIDCLFHLPESADAKWVSDALDQKAQELQPRIKSNEDAAVAYNDLQDLKNDRLAAVLAGKKRKEDILKLKDPDRRRLEFARCYLGLEPNGYVDLESWGLMMLQRDCNENDPPALAATFLQGFDMIQSRGKSKEPLPAGDEHDLKIYVTRCKRAVEFYLGQLNDKQRPFAEKYQKDEQHDVLCWDPEDSQ
jgi:hypothetical protein